MVTRASATETILIFPSSQPEAVRYFLTHSALSKHKRYVAASGLRYDDLKDVFPAWEYLPFVYDAGFKDAFASLMQRHKITKIFCTSDLAHHMLEPIIAADFPKITVETGQNFHKDVSAAAVLSAYYDSMYDAVYALDSDGRHDAPSALHIRREQFRALMHLSEDIPGYCAPAKMLALCAIAETACAGDIVEIGGFLGRSATAFAYLSKVHQIGKLLVIDPWQADTVIQHDSVDAINASLIGWNWKDLLNCFCLNMAPFIGDINYVKGTSEQAFIAYSSNSAISTPTFGDTSYQKQISILHIDGNHDYEIARKDWELWSRYLLPDGWVIFDDYKWSHGDGPKRVGDEVLAARAGRIRHAFVAGNALFVQFMP